MQQGAHGRHSIQPEARSSGPGSDPDGDRLGGQGFEKVLIGAIIANGEHRRGGQPLGRERWDDPPLVNAVLPDLDDLVPRQDLDRLIAEQLSQMEP